MNAIAADVLREFSMVIELLLQKRSAFSSALFCAAVGLLQAALLTKPAHAAMAEKEFVGILALVMEADVSKELGLSDEQKRQLGEIVDEAETAAMELALQLKSAPAAEREERLGDYRRKVELKGLALLTVAQRQRLAQIHLARQAAAPPAATTARETEASNGPPAKTATADSPMAATAPSPADQSTNGSQPAAAQAAPAKPYQETGNSSASAGTPSPAAPAERATEAAAPSSQPAISGSPEKPATLGDAGAMAPVAPTATTTPGTAATAPGTHGPTTPADGGKAAGATQAEAPPATEDQGKPVAENGQPDAMPNGDQHPTEEHKTNGAPATAPSSAGEKPADPRDSGQPAAAATPGAAAPEQPAATAAAPASDEDEEFDRMLEDLMAKDAGPKGPSLIRFSFRYAPWKEVLDWFARQADLSFVTEAYPPGTFNYVDDREYTPAQAIDIINSVLLTKGYTLIRRERALMLINLEDGIPPNLVETLTPEQLDAKGEYELVSVLFQLDKLTPEEAEIEIKRLLGPQGSIIALPKSRQIQITETAGRLRAIRSVIQRVEDPQGFGATILKPFELKHAEPAEALPVLRQLMDIPEGGNASLDGSIRIAVDAANKRFLASGKAEKLNRLEEILKFVDVPKTGQATTTIDDTPQLEVYSITTADSQSVLAVLQTLLSGLPDVRLAIDAKTGNVIALARRAEHATIRATIDQLQRDARRVEVFQLRNVDPQLAVLSINKLFNGSTDPKTPPPATAPQVDADPTTRQLMVRATTSQIEQIRELLVKLGENESATAEEGTASTSKVRMIPLKGRSAQAALEQLELVWPTVRQNRIRVVTPSAVIPSVRPSSTDDSGPSGGDYWLPPAGGGNPSAPGEFDPPPPTSGRGIVPMPHGPHDVPGAAPSPTPPAPRADSPAASPAGRQPAPEDENGKSAGRRYDLRKQVPVIFAAEMIVADPSPADSAPGPIVARPNAGNPVAATAEQAHAAPGPAARASAAAPKATESTDGSAPAAAGAATGAAPARRNPADLPPIVVSVGPGGIMIASEDVEALNEFEELLNQIASGPAANLPEMTIFYLKHAKAGAVAETLEQIFSGATGGESGGGGGGGLLGDMAGAALGDRGGLLGTLLGLGGGGDGGSLKPTGAIKITPDSRLNALVVQANASDTQMIEQLLKILDQRESPEEVLIVPKAKIIALKNTQAQEVVDMVRQVYSDRVMSGGGQQAAAQPRPPSPQEFMQMLRGSMGGRRGGGGGGAGGRGGSQEETQKMSLAIDPRTNSVILAAPEPLFTEVQQLIDQIDKAALVSNQTMKVVTLRKASSDSVRQGLAALVGDNVQFGSAGGQGRGATRRPTQVNRPTGGQTQPQIPGMGAPGGFPPQMMPQMPGGGFNRGGAMGGATGGRTGGTGAGRTGATGGGRTGGTGAMGGRGGR